MCPTNSFVDFVAVFLVTYIVVAVLVGVLQRNRTNRNQERGREEGEREIDFYYEGLTHMIMETEKSHDLPSASWRPRKTSGIISA